MTATPYLLTLYGYGREHSGSSIVLGGDRGPALDIGSDGEVDLGVIPIGTILTAVGGVVRGIASGVSSGRRRRKAQQRQARQAAAAQAATAQAAATRARRTKIALIAGGGVVALGVGAYLLTR